MKFVLFKKPEKEPINLLPCLFRILGYTAVWLLFRQVKPLSKVTKAKCKHHVLWTM